MDWVYISDIAGHVGKEVEIKGWLYNKRHSGKLWFLQVRDGTGVIQCVVFKGDVDEETLRQYKKERHRGLGPFKKPVMVGTINKELTTITTVLNRACMDWPWIPSVPRIRHMKGAKRQA
ncbi:hypothetical protein IID62_07945, partial [candidate division KSB1 bacterium]|nr:hypothetical protein [candidate division KSB1 bacterium]